MARKYRCPHTGWVRQERSIRRSLPGTLRETEEALPMTAAPRRTVPLLITLLALALLAPAGMAAAPAQTFAGRLSVAHGDDYSGGSAHGSGTWDYRLVTSGGTFRLAFSGARPDGFLNGASVRVRGNLVGNTVAVGANRADAQVDSQVVAQVTGTKKVALLLVNFVLKNTQPWTLAQAAATLFTATNSVANYFAEESYGALTVSGDVFGYYTIDFDINTCNYTDLGNKANAAATAAGVNLGNYTNVQYAFPSLPCGWSGLAYMPGTQTWLNNNIAMSVSAHELSHNFGVHHASTLNCLESGVRVALSANLANCTASEYGDPFSVMGNGSRHTHSQQLATLGWATGSALVTASTSGTYTLGAADDPASAVKAIRVARGNGTYLYLELRKPWGTFDNFSASDPVVNGVSLRIANDWNTIIQSKLIDTTPATSSWLDGALAVGASFTDPLVGVTVTTVSVSGGVATVNVSWGPDVISPSQPGSLAVAMTGVSTARLTWAAATDNVGVTGYQVRRDGNLLNTVTGTSFDDAGLVARTTYGYTVVAVDGAGNSSTAATRSLTVPFADTTKPSAPSNLHTTSLTKAKVSLAWTGSTDNVGIAGYRVYRNGSLVATTSSLTWSQPRQRTASTYTVVAYDAAGNVSPTSNAVTVAAK
jgi:chitodextrinase